MGSLQQDSREETPEKDKKALTWLLCSLTSILHNLCGKHLRLKQKLILPALFAKDSLGLRKCTIWIHLMMNGELLLRVESRFLFQRISPKLLKQKSLTRWTLRLHLSLPRLRWASLELVVFLYRQLQKYTSQIKSPSHGNQNLWLKKSNLDFLGLVDSLKMKSIWMKMKFQ